LEFVHPLAHKANQDGTRIDADLITSFPLEVPAREQTFIADAVA
jgi:hypothetical protein